MRRAFLVRETSKSMKDNVLFPNRGTRLLLTEKVPPCLHGVAQRIHATKQYILDKSRVFMARVQ